jgi:hypothetical protein
MDQTKLAASTDLATGTQIAPLDLVILSAVTMEIAFLFLKSAMATLTAETSRMKLRVLTGP